MNYGYYPNYNYTGYQQPTYQTQAQQASPTMQDDRIWVASEAAAEAYPIQAGGFLRLWDGNKPIFYEKRADVNGRPFPLVKYEYKVSNNSTETSQNAPISNDIEERVKLIEEEIKTLKKANRKPTTAKEKNDDE